MSFKWMDGRWRQPLPIDSRLQEILDHIEANQVVVVEAETGAGKTTRIPQAALLADSERDIYLTQTRRNAVRWNGKRIASEMGGQPGGIVGWRLFGETPMVSRATRLTLVVDQSLTNTIRRTGGLPEGLLIIDEAHERSVSTDLLLGLIKEGLPQSPNTRVLVTSATIDTKKFSDFFGGAPVVSVTGRCFPVSTEVVRLSKYEHHSQAAARAAEVVLERFSKNELTVPMPEGQATQVVSKGTVLILLPGKEDITQVMRAILRQAEKLELKDRVEILSCHGESSPEEQDAVQSAMPDNTLRFVCGTEVLRSSVTVQNTIGVIDSIEVKRLIVDAKGVAHLDKVPISMAEADQAKGRAGRTQPGFYMPVSFEREFEGLRRYPMPAILREPITHVALQVASVGRNVRDFAFIDPPEKEKVEVALTRLKRLGALDEQEKITETGELLVQFPVDPERAKVLVTADRLGVLPEAVIVTAVLESEGIFYPPKDERAAITVDEQSLRQVLCRVKKDQWGDYCQTCEAGDPSEVNLTELPEWIKPEGKFWKMDCDHLPYDFHGGKGVADLVRRTWSGDSQSDFVAIVRAYRAFKTEERRLREEAREDEDITRKDADQALYAWTVRNFLNHKRLRQAEHIMAQIREELASSPLRLNNGIATQREFDTEALTKALASGMIDNVSVSSQGYGYAGPLGEFQLARQSVCKGGQLIFVGGVRKIPVTKRGRTTFLHLADLATAVKPEWLAEVMPQLCAKKRLGDYRYDEPSDAVVETQKLYFVEMEVGQQPVAGTDDEKAVQVFAAWIGDQILEIRRY